jgi:colanic acid biosynthesis glycosyl transferase WcaI
MKIALISLNYAPEMTGIGLYSSELAQQLAAQGHEVSVICSYPFYPEWLRHESYPGIGWLSRTEEGVEVHRCPCYIPAQVSGLRRIIHYISFALAAVIPAIQLARRGKPDIVLLVAPALLAAFPALIAARLAGAQSWLHIQDFEVEAGFATGQMGQHSLLGKCALWLEKRLLSRFDRVTSISPEMCSKAAEKGVAPARIGELRNWANIDGIAPQESSFYRGEWSICTPHVALYSGSIARKQGIETVIDTARIMSDRGDITFVICGNGPTRSDLERLARGLPNVQFHDLQPMAQLNELLNLATVHLLPQKRDAADLVLPSKLANMLASGRPVVAGVEPGRGLAREVEGAGLICPPEDGASMAEAIERLISDEELYRTCATEARARAEKRWSKSSIIAAAEREMVMLAASDSGVGPIRDKELQQ